MAFEYDPKKSRSNQAKHGINFDQAQELWLDPARVEIPALKLDEPRILVIGKISEKLWAAVITPRGAKIRLISVRRARKEEEAIYESEGI
jgi:uncharacterized DUF497 family protein